MVLHSLKSIIINPILFMTLLGILGGFLLQDGVPKVFAGVLKVRFMAGICDHD